MHHQSIFLASDILFTSYPFPPYTQVMPTYTGVIGALGVVAPAPMLDPALMGDLGLVC